MLLAHAVDGLDTNVAAKLIDTARRLREEAAVRAEIAFENFVGLDLNGLDKESSLPSTITLVDRIERVQSASPH